MPLLTVNGIALNVEGTNLRSSAPLLLLHGFTGSVATWEPLLPAFQGRPTLRVDLVGHGDSAAPEALDHYRLPVAVSDLAALLDQLALPRIALLGYSLGGRVALHFALAYPERVTALVLESASAGLSGAEERAARQRSDEDLAERIERDGIAAFVQEWERLPLFSSQQRLPADVQERQRAQRLRQRPRGLANSLRGMGAGVTEPVWERLGELSMPVLLLTGAMDDRYCRIAQAMAARLPAASLAVVPDAGHAVHLEQPEAFTAAVLNFLDGAGSNAAISTSGASRGGPAVETAPTTGRKGQPATKVAPTTERSPPARTGPVARR